jgi:hypothetical protein
MKEENFGGWLERRATKQTLDALKKERKSEKEGRKTKTRKRMAIEESSEDNEGRNLENEGRIVHWVRRIEDSNNKLE